MTRTWQALGAGIILAATLSACGGGGGGKKAVDVEDWVADVCDLAVNFNDDFEQSLEDLADINPGDRGAKDDVVALFEEALDLEDDLIADIEDLGAPDLDDGEEIRDTMQDRLEDSRDRLAGLIDDLNDIDEDDFEDDGPDAFADFADADADRPSLREVLEDVGRDGDDVIELIEDDDDCVAVLFASEQDEEEEEEDEEEETPTRQATQGASTRTPTRSASPTPSSGVSNVDTWTEGLCDAFVSWQTDITTLAGDADFDNLTEPEEVKDALVVFFEDILFRTWDFQLDVDLLDPLDIDQGQAIQFAYSDAIGQVADVFEDTLDEVILLDTSDPAALADALTALGEQFGTAGTDIAANFDQINKDYDTTPILEAAEDIPACAPVFTS